MIFSGSGLVDPNNFANAEFFVILNVKAIVIQPPKACKTTIDDDFVSEYYF